MNRGYNVYRNDRFVRFVHGRNRAVRVNTARQELNGSTHMGEWKRIAIPNPEDRSKSLFEYEYCTTIGVYIRFMPEVHL